MAAVIVDDSFTLDQGEKLGFSNEDGIFLVGPGSPSVTIAGVLVLKVDGAGVGASALRSDSTTNHATVWIQQGGLVRVTGESSDASGVAGAFQSDVSFVNDGFVIVAGSNDGLGLSFADPLASCVNNEVISVAATGHQGVGVSGTVDMTNVGILRVSGGDAKGAWLFNGSFLQNSGRILVKAEGAATGVDITGNFTNDGLLKVAGGDGPSIGVAFHQQPGFNVFHNHGEIDVSGEGTCVGVQIVQADEDRNVFDNSGLIRATIAFSAAPVADHAQIVLNNTGRIIGLIELTDQDDDVGNNGKIVGDVRLADGDDSYLTSRNGKLVGSVFGGAGDDQLTGGKLGEQLHGDEAKHSAHDGADTITGGEGGDTLTGGGGADVFVYLAVTDSAIGHTDLISDLANADTIDLSTIDADIVQSGDQAFVLVSVFTGHAGELTLVYDAGSDRTNLSGDVDGDGQADLQIQISGDHHDFSRLAL